MGTYTITYPAKCKDCHFHKRGSEGKRTVIKCLKDSPDFKKGGIVVQIEKIKLAPKTTLRTPACDSFILWGTSEERVDKILEERNNNG